MHQSGPSSCFYQGSKAKCRRWNPLSPQSRRARLNSPLGLSKVSRKDPPLSASPQPIASACVPPSVRDAQLADHAPPPCRRPLSLRAITASPSHRHHHRELRGMGNWQNLPTSRNQKTTTELAKHLQPPSSQSQDFTYNKLRGLGERVHGR